VTAQAGPAGGRAPAVFPSREHHLIFKEASSPANAGLAQPLAQRSKSGTNP